MKEMMEKILDCLDDEGNCLSATKITQRINQEAGWVGNGRTNYTEVRELLGRLEEKKCVVAVPHRTKQGCREWYIFSRSGMGPIPALINGVPILPG